MLARGDVSGYLKTACFAKPRWKQFLVTWRYEDGGGDFFFKVLSEIQETIPDIRPETVEKHSCVSDR